MITNYLLVLSGYLIGAIPFGLIYGKLVGIDVRQNGSGNIGATNVSRLLGKKLGLLTLISDAAKGLIPMALAGWLLKDQPGTDLWVALCGTAAFLGHIFPVYLKFKGGKGVATALGIFLYLNPLAALAAVVIFIAVVYLGGYVSLGSLLAAAAMPLIIWQTDGSREYILMTLAISVLIWIKHHENIGRLIRKEEKSWKKKESRNG
ncbi:MAG: glycerol-3-phosphate 1-O-acyltransferase PlsY [Proteobacteria bacterium]|nr:glycerol-3-phosphate 1-O-acyltransferase PlsY [Pseudomonadota bacterium]MBU1716459.1 glycerol-3-phosphate 1-O-acyltransferase PlsY [Pseudomonadota bacterium]